MRKLIDLDTAIDEVLKESNTDGAYGYMDTKSIVDLLNGLSSSQPEIVKCKDCKYYKKDHGWNCIEYTVCAISPLHKVIRKPDDYCSRAERRTDERTD